MVGEAPSGQVESTLGGPSTQVRKPDHPDRLAEEAPQAPRTSARRYEGPALPEQWYRLARGGNNNKTSENALDRAGRSGGGLAGVGRDDPELDLGVDVLAEVELDRVEAQLL